MIYTFDDFELDTELFELRRRGRPLAIEPQVFNVLRYLIENADHVVTKDELLENLWPAKVVSESALTSKLKIARKLIRDDGKAQRLIKTVHGRGYRFVGGVDSANSARQAPAVALAPERRTPPPVDVEAPPGRVGDLTALERQWQAAEAGELQLAFVEGEAGIGKTTLLDALVGVLRRRGGCRIGLGQCIEQSTAGEAYMPVLDALGALAFGADGTTIIAALETYAPSWLLQLPGALSADERATLEQQIIGVTQQRMIREFAAALTALSSDLPLLLVLEDLHWADPSTLALLAWLGRRKESMRAMIVGSHRPIKMKDAGQSLYEVAYGLRLRGLAKLMRLDALDEKAVAAHLARRFEGHALDSRIIDTLHERTEGNPLFLVSVLDNWLERGLLRSTASGLELDAAAEALSGTIPENLRVLIEEQMARLGPEDRQLLIAASVAGDRFSAALIDAMLGANGETCEADLAQLVETSSFLMRDDEAAWPDGTLASQFRFRHTLYRETIYSSLPAQQRSRLHALAAERLERGFGEAAGDRAVELALHFTAGGEPAKATNYRLQAAQQAYARGGYREVIGHLDAGLDLLEAHPELPDHEALELAFQLLIAPALIQTNGWSDPRAESSLVRAIELATRREDNRLPSALYLLAAVHELRGEYSETQRLLERQQAMPGSFDNALAELESHELLACSLFHQGAFDDALRHARAGLATGGNYDINSKLYAYGENPRVSCYNWAGLALWFLGFPDQATATIEAGLALARKPARRFSLSNALAQAATLQQLRGQPDLARAFAEEAIDVALEEGFRYPLAVARIIKGWAMAVTAGVEPGLALIREGLTGHRASGAAMDRPYYLGLLAEALLAGGDRAGASAALDEALANIDPNRRFFHEAELLRLAAKLSLEQQPRKVEKARELLQRSFSVAENRGNRIGMLRARVELLRLATRSDDKARHRDALRQIYAGFSEGFEIGDLKTAAALLQ